MKTLEEYALSIIEKLEKENAELKAKNTKLQHELDLAERDIKAKNTVLSAVQFRKMGRFYWIHSDSIEIDKYDDDTVNLINSLAVEDDDE